jgi:spore germination protein KB
MKTVNKITCFEYGILIYFLIRSMSLGISMNSYIHIGGVDGYLSPIIGTIIGFIPLFIFIKILNYKPELNIFEKIDFLFNKKIGLIINIIITGTIFYLVTIVFWDLLNFIGSEYLFRTSIMYVSTIFGICFIYTCTKKLKVIIRSANILFYISIVIFIICFLGLLGNPKLDNLLPFLEYGIKNPLLSGLSHVTYSILPLFILLLIPKNDIKNNNKLNKTIILFYLIASIGKCIVTFLTIATFGIDLAKLYEFPDFLLLRRISTTGFFQRFESILATQWIFDLFIMICMCFQFIKNSYKHIIKNKYQNLFISIVIIITCIISSNFLFKNNTLGDTFILYKLPFILAALLFGIPIIIFIKIIKKPN